VSVVTVQRALSDYFQSEFEVQAFDEGRLVCEMPIYYPDGNSVAVFVIEQAGKFEVTDYGEGYANATERTGIRRTPIKAAAREICASLGLDFAAGRVSVITRSENIADAAWRVATASARIAEAVTFARAERGRGDEDIFTEEVEHAIRSRQIPIEREPKLVGDSGHEYTPALFIPAAHLIVEPIAPEVAWIRAASVYAEFGDLAQANGYRLLAVVDDREAQPSEKVVRLLKQVGDVENYSRRERWLASLRSGDNGGS
jgi:hypothetical protein